MASFTFMFPGQGSQKVGMGSDIVAAFDCARRRFEEANEILGRDIMRLCFEGPEDALTATQNTQPALFTLEAALCDILSEKGVHPAFTLGHSLGEYGAMYAAGVFSFAQGLRLVAKRGELMAQAGAAAPGTMAAILGLPKQQITDVLASINEGILVCANENAPQQTVISGEVAAVKTACDKLIAAGAKRAIPLSVSGAFHSPLMKQASSQFAEALKQVTFSAPRCPVITNVTAGPVTDPSALRDLLVRQLVSSVRWVDSLKSLAQLGAVRCLEVGPGSVLKGLAGKNDGNWEIVPCGSAENVYSLLRSQGLEKSSG
jgi:[acyl-carrier-protein] S-malonyltransferase